MNKILLLTCFLMLVLKPTKAQPYHSMIAEKIVWTSIDCFQFGPFEDLTRRKEMMLGDTTISGKSYKKVYQDTSINFNIGTAKYVCAIREEDRKVYYVDTNSILEYVLYDFTKNVGDSITVRGLGDNYPDQITLNVDSIFTTTIFGIQRKTYKFNANGSYHNLEYWYEGIGSSFGFLTPFVSVPDNFKQLKCTSKNDTIIYSDTTFLCSLNEPNYNCEYDFILATKNTLLHEINIYPNPSNGKVTIDTDLNIHTIELFTSMGQKVYVTNNKELNVENLEKGLYLLVLTTKDRYIVTRKIIIP